MTSPEDITPAFAANIMQFSYFAERAADRARALGLTLDQAAKLSETYFPMPDEDGRT